jgi:hypothetical protein
MNKRKLLFFVAIVIYFSFVFLAKADTFVIHLYYDKNTNTLNFNRNNANPITIDKKENISILEFANDNSVGSHVLKLYDIDNVHISDSEFNLQDGPFEYKVPYFSTVIRAEIIDKLTGKKILEADLSKFVSCNGNRICEFEKGENIETCLNDCGNSSVKFSNQTKNLLDDNNGTIRDDKTGEVLLKGIPEKKVLEKKNDAGYSGNRFWNIILIVVTSLLVLGVIIFAIKKLKNLTNR